MKNPVRLALFALNRIMTDAGVAIKVDFQKYNISN